MNASRCCLGSNSGLSSSMDLMDVTISFAIGISSNLMWISCLILRFVILDGFSMMKVENLELGIYRGRFSHVLIIVMYHPISSTVPSTSVFSILRERHHLQSGILRKFARQPSAFPTHLLIQSPTLKGLVKKSINPAKKFEIISRPAKPIATPPIPPKASTDWRRKPIVSIITSIAMRTVTTVASRLIESTCVLSIRPSLEKRDRILSIHRSINHVAAKIIPSSRDTRMYLAAPVAESGLATTSAREVPTVKTERNSRGLCMHSNTDSL
mmetsp:Transcript_19250/g.77109  ORF Transcript_19250/g.77109 Transcript_19250/m.77109 type:complete len:269 (-) Transcript_19250:916-1722(-)